MSASTNIQSKYEPRFPSDFVHLLMCYDTYNTFHEEKQTSK